MKYLYGTHSPAQRQFAIVVFSAEQSVLRICQKGAEPKDDFIGCNVVLLMAKPNVTNSDPVVSRFSQKLYPQDFHVIWAESLRRNW